MRKLVLLGGVVALMVGLLAPAQATTSVLYDGVTASTLCLQAYGPGATAEQLSACQWDMRMIQAGPEAWANATGEGVTVGVIDGGIDFTHPDLAGQIDVALSCSFIYSTTPTADPQEIANGDCSNKAAVQDLQGRLGEFGKLSFLVQKFLPGGRELIVGASAERGLGHLVMFGLGGVYVEVLRDVAFKIAPVTRVEAREMLASLKAKALLDGVRGEKGVDREKVVDLILRVSALLGDLPEIREMDLNPVMAFEDAVYAVDGRIRI